MAIIVDTVLSDKDIADFSAIIKDVSRVPEQSRTLPAKDLEDVLKVLKKLDNEGRKIDGQVVVRIDFLRNCKINTSNPNIYDVSKFLELAGTITGTNSSGGKVFDYDFKPFNSKPNDEPISVNPYEVYSINGIGEFSSNKISFILNPSLLEKGIPRIDNTMYEKSVRDRREALASLLNASLGDILNRYYDYVDVLNLSSNTARNAKTYKNELYDQKEKESLLNFPQFDVLTIKSGHIVLFIDSYGQLTGKEFVKMSDVSGTKVPVPLFVATPIYIFDKGAGAEVLKERSKAGQGELTTVRENLLVNARVMTLEEYRTFLLDNTARKPIIDERFKVEILNKVGITIEQMQNAAKELAHN